MDHFKNNQFSFISDKFSGLRKLAISIFFGILLLVATIFSWRHADQQNQTYVENEVHHILENMMNEFVVKFTGLLLAQDRIASRWEVRGGTPQVEFEHDVREYVQDHSEFQAIEWVDSDGVAKWIVPLQGNEAALGWDNKKDTKRWSILQKAKTNNEMAFSQPINLLQGGKGLLVFAPIIYGDHFDGYILAVYKFENLLKPLFESNKTRKLNRIDFEYNGSSIYQFNQKLLVEKNLNLSLERNVYGQSWKFTLSPGKFLLSSYQSYYPVVIFVAGLILSFALPLALYFALYALEKQRALEKSHEDLVQMQKMEAIGNLAGGIAHDFNNILGGIIGYASLLEKALQHDEKLLKKVHVISQAAIRGGDLTKKLLGYARKGQYELTIFSLNSLVTEVFGLIKKSRDTPVVYKFHLADDLKLVEGDSTQIFQVILNLVNNALDAMPKGGTLSFTTENEVVTSETFLTNIDPGSYVKVVISDTGVGISKELQKKVFDPFFTTKQVGKGTGLGLSMVMGIMKNHGGEVVLESTPGEGTNVSLYFPEHSSEDLPQN